MNRTVDEWIELFRSLGALWLHDGNPRRPHALLTSGRHSNGFFNGGKIVFDHPIIAEEACADLVEMLRPSLKTLPQLVVGSAFGAITIARDFAKSLLTGFAFTEPVGRGKEKEMVLNSRFNPSAGTVALAVEDVMTTGRTTEKTISILEAKGVVVLPFVCVLVNRSGKTHLGEREIIALINHPMPDWEASECPLCQQGSEAIRPKGNWNRLTAAY